MFDASLSNDPAHLSARKSNYLENLRREIDRYANPDPASKLLFLAEIEQHIEMLCESLECDSCSRSEAEATAIAMMERPCEIARALNRADSIARASAPCRWFVGMLRAWTQFLQLRSTLILASLVSLACVLAALFLAAVIPNSWQEYWIVPAVAAAVFAITAQAGRLLESRSWCAVRLTHCLWLALFALGAHLATYAAEALAALDSGLAMAAAYGALILTISCFAAAAFAGWYFQGATSRFRFFRISFPAVLAVLLLATLMARGLAGAGHGVLFYLYALFGASAIYATHRYVVTHPNEEMHLEACTR